MFALINTIVSVALSTVLALIDPALVMLSYIYSLAVMLPSIGVGVRRLHDVGKSGWFLFIALIPLIGIIWLLILMVKEGDTGPNQYGADPKGGDSISGDQILDGGFAT